MTNPESTASVARSGGDRAPIPFGRPVLSDRERQLVAEVLGGTQLTQGPMVLRLEAAFERFTGAQHAVATSSCMGALHLAYLFLGLERGDEVIVPAQTHVATAMAVELSGGRCVFVDSEPETGNLDLDLVEAHITPRTRAISVVHYLGMPVEMRRLCAIAEVHGLFVVEDCALAVGAMCDGVHVGLHGDAGAFSFYPVKHVATGEGGMLVTRRSDLARAAARQRAFGVERVPGANGLSNDYDVAMIGLNYRMSELPAALGVAQVERLPETLAARRANYDALTAGLRSIDDVTVFRSSHDHLESAYYCHSILLTDAIRPQRGAIVAHLAARDIGSSVYYPRPVPFMSYFQRKYGHRSEDFPVASRISAGSLALPVGPHLQEGDVDRIVEALKEAIAHARNRRS